MPKMDLGKLEDDMGSIEDTRGQLRPRKGMGAGMTPARPKPAAGMPKMDLGKLEDDMGSIEDTTGQLAPKTPRQMKARGDIRAAMGMKKGGSVGSASKRADGIATKGKTKGRIV